MRIEPTTAPVRVRLAYCRTCRTQAPAGSRVNGDCPSCAGLVGLDLRGEGGRFLPGLTPTRTTPTRTKTTRGAR